MDQDDYRRWLYGEDVEEDLRKLVEIGVDEFELDHGIPESTADNRPTAKLHGRKKVLAPYVTDLIDFRQFLEECQQSLQHAQSLPVLAKFMHSYVAAERPSSIAESDDQPCSSVQQATNPVPVRRKITESSDRQAVKDQQKMQTVGLGTSASEHRSCLAGLKVLRNRIKKSAPKYAGKPPGMQECLQRAPNLRTLAFRAEEHHYAEHARSGSNLYCRSMYSGPCIKDTMVRRVDRKPETRVEDIIITVYVYRGKLPSHQSLDGSRLLPKKYLIAYCLGSNTVDDLVNLIQCPFDSVLANETGSQVEKEFSEQGWKTERLVCIANTIFTDAVELESSRASYYQEWYAATDSSKEIVIEPLDSRSLLHIPVQLGYPYLYKHGLAGCEHWLVFTDARLLHVDDEGDISKYPRAVLRLIPRCPACSVCGNNQSKWHISNSERFPTVRSYLCTECNSSFNYDQAGNQIEEKAVITALPPHQAASSEIDAVTGELAFDEDGGNV